MLTLLNMTFGTSTHVPSTLHEFYESMFLFLVYRHDETKPGFVREKATQLSNAELQDSFEHFAYLSKEFGVSLTDEEFAVCAKNAATLSSKKFSPEDFRKDLTETVCLMMKDGLRTAYIHRSIQEFFAAFFVKHLGSEGTVEKIYNNFADGNVMTWQQELRFLEQIDGYRYIEYFRLPAIRSFLTASGYVSGRKIAVTKSNFTAFMLSQPIYYMPKHIGKGHPASRRENFFLVALSSTKAFNSITFELTKLFDCDGILADASQLNGMSTQPELQQNRFAKRLPNWKAEADAALDKFRDFAARLDEERQKLELTLKTRKSHFRDLLFAR